MDGIPRSSIDCDPTVPMRSYGTSCDNDENDFIARNENSISHTTWRPYAVRSAVHIAAACILISVSTAALHARNTLWSRQSSNDALTSLRQQGNQDSKLDVAQIRADSVRSLSFTARNEYGEYEPRGLSMYGVDMIVEPYRETTVSVQDGSGNMERDSVHLYSWHLIATDESGRQLDDVEAKVDVLGGHHINIVLTDAGTVYSLTVEERSIDGTVLAHGTATVACKYVRRELRRLNQHDRDGFFNAMLEYYTISRADGEAKYGEDFTNYEVTTALHNVQKSQFCYHAGLQFLTAHVAFGLMTEKSLRMIDPKVSLAWWDFLVDASTLGSDWFSSDIFSPDMFGAARGSPEENFVLSDGRFTQVKTLWDPENTILDEIFDVQHNPYGFVQPEYSFNDMSHLTRASSHCGLDANTTFATCDLFVDCFEDYNTLSTWESCMELQIHGGLHGWLGGAWDCKIDMRQFSEDHPEYSTSLLTFVLEFLTTNYWPGNSFMDTYNTCDLDCVHGSEKTCGCTCDIDAFDITEDEVYALTESFMQKASVRLGGDAYVSYDEKSRYPYSFMQDGVRYSHGVNMYLLRTIVAIGCAPGAVGYMSGGASPLDPIFWALHPVFEKALHVLLLAPRFRDTFDFSWEDGSCYGSGINDEQPFSETLLGMGHGHKMLTNAELMHLIHPLNPTLPYVYEDFGTWGVCTGWDPCEECQAGAKINGVGTRSPYSPFSPLANLTP